MKKMLKIFLIIGAGSFISGCVTNDAALQQQMGELMTALVTVQKNQADLNLKLEELSENLNVTNENMGETGAVVSRLSAKLDDLAVTTTAVAQVHDTLILPTKIYETAQTNLNEKKYDAAIEGFNMYLEKFPKGEMAESARENIGDANYAKKDYREAAVVYAKLMQEYSKSKKTPTYRLKYARSILPLDKKAEAKKYLQSIVQDYPNSSEAKIAEKELAKIK